MAQKHTEFAAIQICDGMTSTDLRRELSRLCHVHHIYLSNILWQLVLCHNPKLTHQRNQESLSKTLCAFCSFLCWRKCILVLWKTCLWNLMETLQRD